MPFFKCSKTLIGVFLPGRFWLAGLMYDTHALDQGEPFKVIVWQFANQR